MTVACYSSSSGRWRFREGCYVQQSTYLQHGIPLRLFHVVITWDPASSVFHVVTIWDPASYLLRRPLCEEQVGTPQKKYETKLWRARLLNETRPYLTNQKISGTSPEPLAKDETYWDHSQNTKLIETTRKIRNLWRRWRQLLENDTKAYILKGYIFIYYYVLRTLQKWREIATTSLTATTPNFWHWTKNMAKRCVFIRVPVVKRTISCESGWSSSGWLLILTLLPTRQSSTN